MVASSLRLLRVHLPRLCGLNTLVASKALIFMQQTMQQTLSHKKAESLIAVADRPRGF
jgi:hypothetical protein